MYYHFRSVKFLFIISIALVYSTNAFELKCTFSMKTDYSCDVHSLKIDEPHTIISIVSGTHFPDLGNSDVKFVGINDQNIKFLPINFAQHFANLRRIQVTKSQLEYITKNDFLGLTQLTHINIENNKLKELPCGVFDTNKRLQQLHFEENSLNKIGKNIFKPLPLLSLAHFRKNECIDKDVDKIEGVPGLLNEIANKCSIGCEKSSAYPPSSSKDDLEYYKKIINELGNTVYKLHILNENLDSNLSFEKDKCENIEEKLYNFENTVNNITALNHNITKDLDASKIENLKINKEKDELNNNIKKLESKLTQSMKDTKQNEEKCNIIISNKDKNIIENKKEIKTLENTVHGLKKDLDASKVEIFKINKERDALNLNFEEMKTK